MKTFVIVSFSIFALVKPFHVFAQGTFQNLDFEQAQIPPPNQPVLVSQALPNWQVSLNGSTGTTIFYDTFALSLWNVSIYDDSFISGKYSVLLQGGDNGQGVFGYAQISQTGTLANDTHSLLFAGSIGRPGNNLNVAFNGQQLQPTLLQNHGSYSTYGADISAFAGQTGELSFTAPYPLWITIDDIQFSTTSIPEPSTLAMFAIGCGVLLLRLA